MSGDNVKPERSLSREGDTSSSTALEEPFIKRFAELPGEDVLPSVENDYARAKAYLMKQCTETGDNLWDHLNDLLKKILSERPRNIADSFEEFSLKIREARFREKTDHLRDIYVPPEHYEVSQRLMALLQGGGDEMDAPQKNEDEEEQKSRPDLMEMSFYFEQAGVGLPKDEMFCIALHIKKLVSTLPVEKYRFWGKIIGLQKNYYIAEAELSEDELSKRNAEAEAEEERLKAEKLEKEMQEKEEEEARKEQEAEEAKQREEELAAKRKESNMDDEAEDLQPSKPWPAIPPLPKPVKKEQPEIPPEPAGVGINKKTYFVCNCPADEWVELPNVTPQQLIAARKIKRFFTGNLDSEVITFPKFPGTEKNYLRAQIARISAGTQISPLGFYTFNEEEEGEPEEEGGGGKTNYIENPDFEPVGIRDLIDPSMSFWVHHTQYILKQGRTTWWNPSRKEEEGAEEEEEPADEEESAEKEAGPELLTPLSEDAALDSTPPWSVRSSSTLLPEFAIAIVRSNLWPGAYAFAVNKTFENIYIGFGHKYSTFNHTPMPMAEIQEEYPLGPEIMEMPDPTVDDEDEWRMAHEPKTEGGEEGEEEEEEVRDDEDEEEEEE